MILLQFMAVLAPILGAVAVIVSLRPQVAKLKAEAQVAVATSYDRMHAAEQTQMNLMLARQEWLEKEVQKLMTEVERLNGVVTQSHEEIRDWERRYSKLLIEYDRLEELHGRHQRRRDSQAKPETV